MQQSHPQSFSTKSLELWVSLYLGQPGKPKSRVKQAKPQPFGGPFPEPPGPLLVTCWGSAQCLAAVGPGEELGHWEVFGEVLIPPSPATATASIWPAHGVEKPRAATSPREHCWKDEDEE